jgi:hypothetical protein
MVCSVSFQVCINTNRYGCKGCLSTCFPCIFGSPVGYNAGGDNLDQIIFEVSTPVLEDNVNAFKIPLNCMLII